MLTTSTQSSILDLSKEVMMLKNKFNTSIDADILQAFKTNAKKIIFLLVLFWKDLCKAMSKVNLPLQ